MTKFRWLFLLIPATLFVWIAATSTSFAGGEDGVMHHLFARYVPEHPENLLDHWAKPLYVLLSFPFAQFGFFGSLLFNILLALLSAGLLWKTAENLGLKFPWLSPLMLLSANIYFYCVSSSITEILFSFVLTWSLFECTRKRYLLAAIIISFLPFARSEGNALLLVFALGFLFLKQWRALPFLITGTLVYSLAGAYHYNDIFWVWTYHPYRDASDIYKSGPLLHYFLAFQEIWGKPLYLFWLIGTGIFAAVIVKRIRSKEALPAYFWFWFFMVFGSFYTYLIGHSIVWYKGWSASFGLTRVMAAIMPSTVLIAHYAFNRLVYRLNPSLRIPQYLAVLLLAFWLIQTTHKAHKPPFHGDTEREELLKAGEWFRESPYFENKSKVYYFAPTVADAFLVDPFDPEQRGDLSEISWNRDIPAGSIIVWDAHFGPNECHVQLDTLMQRSELEVIHHQKPIERTATLNGYDYEIYLFRKR